MEVVDHDEQAVTSGSKSDQLGGRDEQPLVGRLACPAHVPPRQRPLELIPIIVSQPVAQGRMLAAHVAERLEDRCVRPRSLHRGGGPPTGTPPTLPGDRLGVVEHRRFAYAGPTREDDRAASARLGPLHSFPDLDTYLASSEQPAALLPAAGCCGHSRLEHRPQLLRLGAGRRAELVAQGVVHPLELTQCSAYVTPVGTRPD
jgi:hypothetical protein